MKKKKIILVAGARPNFIKIAPLMRELKKFPNLELRLVHTGQHYDFQMSDVFFKDLGIPRPDIYLNVGSGTQASQTSRILEGFERVLLKERPALAVVVGDVNSTMACALAASKLQVRIAHVEAGLRSFDRTMPEEINRIVTDRLSDYLFVSEESGLRNLKREGIDSKKIFFVGNVMIDSLVAHRRTMERSTILGRLGLRPRSYGVLTLHRPANVDSRRALEKIYAILRRLVKRTRIIYPIHPRSKQSLRKNGLWGRFEKLDNLIVVDPLGYVDFMKLVRHASFVLTDSGGIQEETTFLGIPCLTMRENTERPVTLRQGTNVLVGTDKKLILSGVTKALNHRWKKSKKPNLWDGRAALRVAKVLLLVL